MDLEVSGDIHEKVATFAAGSYWGLELMFRQVPGVVRTTVGSVTCRQRPQLDVDSSILVTQAVEVVFDNKLVSFDGLLMCFWRSHDPIDAHSERPDLRSLICVHDKAQACAAMRSKSATEERLGHPVATSIVCDFTFVRSGADNQQYLERHGLEPRVAITAQPNIELINLRRHNKQLTKLPRLSSSFRTIPFEFTAQEAATIASIGTPARSVLHFFARCVSSATFAVGLQAISDWSSRHGPLARSVFAVRPAATHVEMRHYASTSELIYIANLSPGNCMPSLQRNVQAFRYFIATTDKANPGSIRMRGCSSVVGQRGERPVARPAHVMAHCGGGDVTEDVSVGARSFSFAGIPPASMLLDIGSRRPHRISWRDGDLHLDDHTPTDVARELTVSALGGAACGCIEIQRAWNADWIRLAWHDMLLDPMLESRLLSLTEAPEQETIAGWRTFASGLPRRGVLAQTIPDPSTVDRGLPSQEVRDVATTRILPVLLSVLNRPLQARFVLSSLVKLWHEQERLDIDDYNRVGSILIAPLRESVLESLWHKPRCVPTVLHGTAECSLLDAGAQATASGAILRERAAVHVAVPFRWLTNVWAQGLAVIGRHLVLDIVDSNTDASQLLCQLATWTSPRNGHSEVTVETRRVRFNSRQWEIL